MVTITSKTEPFTLRDVQSILLSYESRLESMNSINSINTKGSVPTANFVTQQRRSNFPVSVNNHANFNRNQQVQPSNQAFKGGRGEFRGRGGRYNNSNRPQCQLCHIFGHIADRCYYRFNTSFTGPDQAQNMNSFGGTTSVSSSGGQMAAMILAQDNVNDTS